ncbi:Hachiman antiphage defense system protein HamA [Mycoplasmatota bacterium WC30]
MEDRLKEILNKVIVFQFDMDSSKLPVSITNWMDHVFGIDGENKDVSEIIFKGIVEYAFNERNIDITKFNEQQLLALERKLRFDNKATDTAKLNYGFYGEILLDLILKNYYNTEAIISKGYFYYPLENNESKGYDSFHIIENDERIELWLGESKFRQQYYSSINEILDSFPKVFSDDYLNLNLLAILDRFKDLNKNDGKLYELLSLWKDSVGFKISDYIIDYNIQLFYPIFVSYDKGSNLVECVDKIVAYINDKYIVKGKKQCNPKWKRFFIFLPVDSVHEIKKGVIEWIESIL